MERNKKTLLLFLLTLITVCAFRKEACPSLQDKRLNCLNDYNRTITCVWNSTHVSNLTDTVCTVHANKETGIYKYNSSCNLEPVDVSRPSLKKCSMIFQRDEIFQSFTVLSVKVTCNPGKQISYQPACHVKLNPPRKPDINVTTVSWFPQVTKRERVRRYKSHLQWKQEDQSWTDIPSEQENDNKVCDWECTVELDKGLLIQGERYEARVRVQSDRYLSTWSEWSPTASWVSPVGRPKPPSDGAGVVFSIAAGAAAITLVLAVVLLKLNKTIWIEIKKRISCPPLPDPGKSFLQNFQNYLSPHFTESFHSLFQMVEIVSVEITSPVDVVALCSPEAALLDKMRNKSSHESTSSNFSNPSYSQLCPPPPPPPVSSLTAGNLDPCAADTPYGPVGCQSEDKNAEQDMDEVRGKDVEILQLLSKGSDSTEPMPVISDYEKVEKLHQFERFRLQSLDSGVCSGEEVSQESLEADSINVTDSHDEGSDGNEEREGGNGEEVAFQKLFGGNAAVFSKGSIQVCSDYERVQKLPADSPELPSLDSGVSSGGEEQMSQEESLEDVDKSTESTSLLFPPPSSSSTCSFPSVTPPPLNFSGPGSSETLQPLPSHILERIALMSTTRCVEPSGDGYMPVSRKEQS